MVATGESHSVREFLDVAAGAVRAGLERASSKPTRAICGRPKWITVRRCHPRSREQLGWRPTVSFEQLVRLMVDHDLELARQEQTLTSAGHKVVLRGVSHG